MAKRDELILCAATLLPDPLRPDAASLELEVEAAQRAGFAGISLWSFHASVAASGGRSPEEVREFVLGSGLSVPMVEAILPWGAESDAAAIAQALPTLEMARDYGAQHVIAVTMDAEIRPVADSASRLRAVAEAAGDYGLGIAVEFLPWSGIPTLLSAWQLVESAGRDNAGIMVDGWHWKRQPGGPAPDVMRSIPGEVIVIHQLSDAGVEPEGAVLSDAEAECMSVRALPGEGTVDQAQLLALLDEIGAAPILAPEVFNTDLAALGANEMARQIYDASVRVIG